MSTEVAEYEWVDATGAPTDDTWTQAVLASLFTDRRWADGPEGDRRGWWADGLGQPVYGSGIWRHTDRGRLTGATVAEVQAQAEQALAWLVASGAASAVQVQAIRSGASAVQLRVVVQRRGAPLEVVAEVI